MAPRKSKPAEAAKELQDIEDRAAARQEAAAPAPPAALQILELYVENIKRVRVAHIKPKGNMIVVAGKNGSGKSSVLDAIAWGLTGTSTVPTQPIRMGQRTGKVQVDIGDFRITRYFTRVDNSSKGNTYMTRLVVEGKRKETFPNPQTLLNELMGKISFDPLAFLRMKEPQQLETLRGLVKFDIDIDALDVAQKADYEERRLAGRGVDAAKARLAMMSEPPADLPTEPINTAEISRKINDAYRHNNAIAEARRKKEDYEGAAMRTEHEAAELRSEAQRILEEAHRLDGQVAGISIVPAPPDDRESLRAKSIAAAESIEISEAIDVDELTRELEQANQVNAAIGRAQSYRETKALLEQAERLHDDLNARMVARADERAAAMARAKMPIDGLSIGDGEVLYSGLPLNQASNAEQIRVSMALAMASNPKLRVLRISDGALLDDDSLQLVAEEAEKHGFQVWIERVDTSGKVAVVMEEGEAHGEDAVPEEKF